MTLDDLHYLGIDELSRLLVSRKVSPVELTEAMLQRIERVDPSLKSYALVTPELGLASGCVGWARSSRRSRSRCISMASPSGRRSRSRDCRHK